MELVKDQKRVEEVNASLTYSFGSATKEIAHAARRTDAKSLVELSDQELAPKPSAEKVEQVVEEARAKAPIPIDDASMDPQTRQDAVTENVSKIVKETFGIGAVREEIDAKITAWRSENINEGLEHAAKDRAEHQKERTRDRDKNKTKNGPKGKRSNTEPKQKGFIERIFDKILEILGIKAPDLKSNGSQATKTNRQTKRTLRRTKSKESGPIAKFLRAIGILP